MRPLTQNLGSVSPSFAPNKASGLFWLLCTAYFLSLIFFGFRFVKAGLPLPPLEAWATALKSTPPKVYASEIFLLFLLLLAAFTGRFKSCLQEARRSPLMLLALGLFGFCLLRIVQEAYADPLLVVRNSAFSWYLALPLCIALLPLRAVDFERFAIWLNRLGLGLLLLGLPLSLHHTGGHAWIPWLGLMPLLWQACSSESRWHRCLVLLVLSISMAQDLLTTVPRTVWIGIPVFFALSAFFQLVRPARLAEAGLSLLLLTLLSLALLQSRPFQRPSEGAGSVSLKKFLAKSETNSGGVEIFRWQLWRDAGQLVWQHPWLGVGLREPVVRRVYAGHGKFLPNEGGFESPGAAPISGPHNSYLNAAARLGLPAALLLLSLHALAFFTLLQYELFFAAWSLGGGVLYAFFNVGLEGPLRSFSLLLFLGAAILAERQLGPAECASLAADEPDHPVAARPRWRMDWLEPAGSRKFEIPLGRAHAVVENPQVRAREVCAPALRQP
jgi:O-antigen ligase